MRRPALLLACLMLVACGGPIEPTTSISNSGGLSQRLPSMILCAIIGAIIGFGAGWIAGRVTSTDKWQWYLAIGAFGAIILSAFFTGAYRDLSTGIYFDLVRSTTVTDTILLGIVILFRKLTTVGKAKQKMVEPARYSEASSSFSKEPEPVSPSPSASQLARSHSIFISYRREDAADVAGRIYDRLVQHFGSTSVFKDVDSIPFGVDFRRHLSDTVGRCSIFLTVIGRQWPTITERPGDDDSMTLATLFGLRSRRHSNVISPLFPCWYKVQ